MPRQADVEGDAAPVYEQIGHRYARNRRSDPRWQEKIQAVLLGQQTLVNVGAGSGSYEPTDMDVIAVEPSAVMIRQRVAGSAPAVCGTAESLPFPNNTFDAALAVLTTHHWADAVAGLLEMRRVAQRLVLVTWDPNVFAQNFWLVQDYLPEIGQRERRLSTLSTVLEVLGDGEVTPLKVPFDFKDGVLGAFWRRPNAYLSAAVRSAMSGIALLDSAIVSLAMDRLTKDLASGAWQARNGHLLDLVELDLGYRLVCFDV